MLSGWNYYKVHTITGTVSGSQTNYPVRLIVHHGAGSDSAAEVYCNSHCKADFSDLRFTAADGTTLLSYWIESKTDSDNAVLWVKIPSIGASPTTVNIRIYYGNLSASDASDGNSVFTFYENFKTTSPIPQELTLTHAARLALPTYAAANQTGYTAKTECRETTLSQQAGNGDTTLVLTEASGFKSTASKITIDGVLYYYTGKTGNTLTGVSGITTTLPAGSIVYPFEWQQSVHPSVLDMGGTQWEIDTGYRYWLAYTPYPNTNDNYEQPCLLASNDKTSWVQPAGLTNPLTTFSGSATHNADPSLAYDADNNRLLIWYFRATAVNRIVITNNYTVTEADTGTFVSGYLSPTVLRVGSTWYMFTCTADSTHAFAYRTASSPDGPWSANSFCTTTGIGYDFAPQKPWHMDIKYYPDLARPWVMLYCTNNNAIGTGSLWLATSTDGIAWAAPKHILGNLRDLDGWIYRPSFFIDDAGVLHLYYSYADSRSVPVLNSTKWHTGYTSAIYSDVLAAANASTVYPRTVVSEMASTVFSPVTYMQSSNHNYAAEITIPGYTEKYTVPIPSQTSNYELAFKIHDSGSANGPRVGMIGAAGIAILLNSTGSKYQVGGGNTTGTGDGTVNDFPPPGILRSPGWKTLRINMNGGTSGLVTMDGDGNSFATSARTAGMSSFYIRMPQILTVARFFITDIRVRPSVSVEPTSTTWGDEQLAGASQTITFGALASKTYGASPITLTATASSGLPVSYASSNTSVATVSGSTATIVGVGSTNITASQAGNETWAAATPVVQVLVVNEATAYTETLETLITAGISAADAAQLVEALTSAAQSDTSVSDSVTTAGILSEELISAATSVTSVTDLQQLVDHVIALAQTGASIAEIAAYLEQLTASATGSATVSDAVAATVDATAVSRVYLKTTPDQLFTIAKQPSERKIGIGIDFRRYLASGETIRSGSIISSISGVAELLRVSGTVVYALLQGGADGQTARVTFTGIGSKGSVVEGDLNVIINEV